MIGKCKICGNERRIKYYDLCDSCYRNKIINIYKYYRLKKEYRDINKIKREKHRKILRMVILYNKNFKEVSDVLEIPQRTISWVVDKYCYQCDILGNERPIEFSGKIRTK